MMAFEAAGRLWLDTPELGEPLPRNVVELFALAKRGVFDLWLSPGTIARLAATGAMPDRPFIHDTSTTSWPIERPHELLTLATFQTFAATLDALHCRAAGPTPSWRGLTLLRRWQQKSPERFAIEADAPIAYDSAPNLTSPLAWQPGLRYVHKLDMNAAYLAVARRVALGAGIPVPTKQLVWQPGVWRVTRGHSVNNFAPIPSDGWYDTATLRVAHEYGQAFGLEEGYIWSTQSTALRGWAELLGNALESVPDGKAYIKTIYTRTMGKLGSRAGTNAIWYRKPHWWRAVVAGANLRVWWLALKCPEICGLATDSIYAVTSTPQLPEPIRARLGNKPGQYRWDWTKPLSPRIARDFGQMKATDLEERLLGVKSMGV